MMINVHSLTGTTSSFTAPAMLTEPANLVLLAQACRVYASNQRQGTAKTKSRGEVARTKKKMYKQKGTGGARHASRNAPIFVGGGVTFGPRGNQNWTLTLTKKVKVQVLVEALRAQNKHVSVLADVAVAKGKTAVFASQLSAIDASSQFLVIYDDAQESDMRGVRNLANATLCRVSQVTAFDVALADKIVITKEAWQPLVKRVGADAQGRLKKAKVELTLPASASSTVVATKSTVAKDETAIKKVTRTKKSTASTKITDKSTAVKSADKSTAKPSTPKKTTVRKTTTKKAAA